MKYNTKITIFFIQTFLLTFICDTLGEPQCSPYHYQEQILERVIEMKFNMNQWAEKMENSETLVKERVANLDEKLKRNEDLETKIGDTREQLTYVINSTVDSNINEMKAVLIEGINKVEKVIAENQQIESRLQDIIVAQTSSLNASLMEQSKSFEEFQQTILRNLYWSLHTDVKTPTVLFKARYVRDQSPSTGDTVIFKTIVQNEGAGYNSNTGIFTAPKAGTYLFTTQFCLYTGDKFAITVELNGQPITAALFGDSDYNAVCASSDGLATLNQGDDVKVVVTNSGSIYQDSDTQYWSYFSGVLLHT